MSISIMSSLAFQQFASYIAIDFACVFIVEVVILKVQLSF